MLKTKIFGFVLFSLAMLFTFSFAQAATDTEKLQPAAPGEAAKIGDLGSYFDEYASYMQLDTALHSSETMHLPDVHIGGTDGTKGGVTYFNGTIINASEGNFPVTVGDDMRIDGWIYRDKIGTTNDNGRPVLFADPISPAKSGYNSVGDAERLWTDGYFSETVWMGKLGGNNVVTEENLYTTNNPTNNYYLGYAGNSQFSWMNVADHDTLSGLSCTDGQIAVYDSETTSWTCGNQTNDSDTLSGLSCSTDQIAKWNGTAWVCAADNDTVQTNYWSRSGSNLSPATITDEVGIGTSTPGSALHVEDGLYAQFENNGNNAEATPPPNVDCDSDDEIGRLYIDTFLQGINGTSYTTLYVCVGASRGWDQAHLLP